ncbi:FAD/NAD(P)-binding domain-containing protein [Trematosphaeria pertusa]|uniref:FAD/NAD(P)-binding domain-containing protein n=1 Tax=Trematosphaeria pertusa TaxID=390896 RepID=A0A6A6IF79_9PLEO|nr:FAD/NAD(P)-binding domain-containing protein [Trematosphaeria pertusa]KAF2248190.1 FAD/NAD(P)-binding domain-containing protein [Trematosphaeria pertusa]
MTPVQQKYMQEAAKRKRPEGTQQFQQLHFSDNDRLRGLVHDPFADHDALDKLPLPIQSGDRIKFLIMGAGIGGILNAVRLVQAGFAPDQIVLVEAAGGLGGTWYWNRYPGLHCDVESYVYMPLIEEMDYVPSHKYASGVEIRSYLTQVVERFRLSDRILYRTQLNGLQWDGSMRAWKIDMTTSRGPGGRDKSAFWVNADFVILVSGLFPYPQVPKIPGLTGFEGSMFHTSRWDYSVTGGSSDTPFPALDKLADKRVGIIGTGATAIQVVPEVAKYAKEVYVFQRTPSQVNSRGQRETDRTEWAERIATGPGWQKRRMENLAQLLCHHDTLEGVNLIDDEWSKLQAYCALMGSTKFGTITPDKVQEHIATMYTLDAEHAEKVRQRVLDIVKDKEIAEKLTPWYPTWCKRPTFSDLYLEAFNKPNVHLVDTAGKGVDSVTPHGIVAGGQEYPIDILIFCTGYRSPGYAHGNPAASMGIEIMGREGRSLNEKITSQGASSLHGCISNGFPNLFWMGVSQASATANYTHTLDVMSAHVSSIIATGHDRMGSKQQHGVVIEPLKDAEEAWAMRLMQGAAYFASVAVCTPGYITLEGEILEKMGDAVAGMKRARGSQWSEGIVSFTKELERWRGEGMGGIEVGAA